MAQFGSVQTAPSKRPRSSEGGYANGTAAREWPPPWHCRASAAAEAEAEASLCRHVLHPCTSLLCAPPLPPSPLSLSLSLSLSLLPAQATPA